MTTLWQVDVQAKNQGKDTFNIFHVLDDNDNADPNDIATFFQGKFVFAMVPVYSDQMITTKIDVKSLSAGTPGFDSIGFVSTGTVLGDPMPTGVHINVKLQSGDQGFRSGNKLIGGLGEASFTDGNPTDGTMDFIQAVFDDIIADLNPDIGVELAIYRPAFSLPGIPAFSLVPTALVRGDSTNNRRRLDFER